jgi:hypothetical protein
MPTQMGKLEMCSKKRNTLLKRPLIKKILNLGYFDIIIIFSTVVFKFKMCGLGFQPLFGTDSDPNGMLEEIPRSGI